MSGSTSSENDDAARRALRDLTEHERVRPEVPRLARFELLEVVGEGATAIVYRARDRELNRIVAVKLLRGSRVNEVVRERFRREARAAAGLSHPHVVTVYDAGEEEADPYLVMELVEGRPFDEVLKEPPGDRRPLLELLEKAARGVSAAHARGIVHRDLKPANILVTPSGEPKVGDFGLAHVLDTRSELTRTGTTLGTPLYMAPEQVEARAEAIGPATDVYALGAMLYEILSGAPPHVGESLADLYARIVRADPDPPSRVAPGVSPDAETIALKALEKDPSRRYANAAEFADDLRRHLDGEPVRARPLGAPGRFLRRVRRNPRAVWVGAGVAGIILVAGILWIQVEHERGATKDLQRKVDRLSAAVDPRPWRPIFDGTSMACFMNPEAEGWEIRGRALVGTKPRRTSLQTIRKFGDGDLRIRFEADRASFLEFNVRLGLKGRYSVSWDRGDVLKMGGTVHEIVFACRGDRVSASLDGEAVEGKQYGPAYREGTVHFSCLEGSVKIHSIEFREPEVDR